MAEEADNTTDNNQDESTQNHEENNTAKKPEKTFTQAELDKVLADRLARERSKMPAPDKLKAYDEWQKSQQTEAEKAAEREKEYQAQQARNTELQRELAVIKAGVKAEDAEYVIFKVGKMEGEFSTNLAKFLAENTKFTEPETTTVDGMKHKPGGSSDPAERLIASMKDAAGLK
jgi:hypothetical protein